MREPELQGVDVANAALGTEGDAVVARLPHLRLPLLRWMAMLGTQRWFIVRLRKPPCSFLRLPTPFTRVKEVEQPHTLKLHMRGCCNGNMRVDVEFPTPHVNLLWCG